MRLIFLILLLPSVAFAHNEDLFPDQSAIFRRIEYADNLQKTLITHYKRVSVSLFGIELEHILILSPACAEIKNYILTGAHQLGILSGTCRWYDGQKQLRVPK